MLLLSMCQLSFLANQSASGLPFHPPSHKRMDYEDDMKSFCHYCVLFSLVNSTREVWIPCAYRSSLLQIPCFMDFQGDCSPCKCFQSISSTCCKKCYSSCGAVTAFVGFLPNLLYSLPMAIKFHGILLQISYSIQEKLTRKPSSSSSHFTNATTSSMFW